MKMTHLTKIITPIIYAGLGLLDIYLSFQFDKFLTFKNHLGLSLFFAILNIIFLFGFFILSTKLVLKIEKTEKPKILDHFRLTIIYYGALIVAIVDFLKTQQQGPAVLTHDGAELAGFGLLQGIELMFIIIILIGILINAIYLYTKSKKKMKIKSVQ